MRAVTAMDVNSNSYASGLGFGADGHSTANAYVGKSSGGGATTETELQANSSLFANSVQLGGDVQSVCLGGDTACPTIDSVCTSTVANPCRTVRGLHVTAHSESYGAGFYSEGIDSANMEISAHNNVYVRGGAQITGLEGVDAFATYDTSGSGHDTDADSFARSTGLFGYVSADAKNNTDLYNTVQFDGRRCLVDHRRTRAIRPTRG